MTGLELLEQLQAQAAPPVVLISAHGDIPMAVEAMSKGAYSFVEKPYDPKRLLVILSHAAEQNRMSARNARLRERLHQLAGLDRVLLGKTPLVAQIKESITGLADSDAPVLVQGETGTGKDLVARALHDLGPRCDKPFVAINAAQLTADQIPNVAKAADTGTLFLDEICACPLDVQPMLLRLIETKEVLLAEQGTPSTLDFRVLSATNEDIGQALADGRFRQDLYHRLNAFDLTLPPLRARREDIELIATRFLEDFAAAYDVPAPKLSDRDRADFLARDWPGNVRELRNTCERLVLTARHGAALPEPAGHGQNLREAVAAFERQMIARALQTHAGRMEDVAQDLGIGRRTLNEKIVKLGLDKEALL
ncbi:MAG: sigma-54 dependent transcriptional regulator, partial [Pseudomonadota bacterium]